MGGRRVVRRYLIGAALLLPALACDPRTSREEAGPPAAVLGRLTGMELGAALELLEAELAAAGEGSLEGSSFDALIRAETVSDRLLETRFPFEWLRSDDYSLQARIRQIQSLADRVEALVRSGAPRDSAVADLGRLRQDVELLRRQLAQGGLASPVPLDRLLAGRDTLHLQSREGATGE